MQYQGHHADGSSVQKHSAGGLYPCVIYAQETPSGLRWGVISPEQPKGCLEFCYNDAVRWAEVLNRKRANRSAK